MNKYFTKYLPVNGEIKEGDKTLLKKKDGSYAIFTRMVENDSEWAAMTRIQGHIPLQLDEMPSYVQYTHPKNLKKYKLFLCSNDIKEGDKVWDTLNEKYQEVTTSFIGNTTSGPKTKCWYLKDKTESGYNQFHEEEFLIKVIGEISPEATWVKEGDEFDESEIKPFFKPKIVAKNQWKDYSVIGRRELTGEEKIVYPLAHSFSNSIWTIPVNPITHAYKIKGQCGHFH